jgi:hypothetical protein
MGRRYLPTTWTGDISPEQIVNCSKDPNSPTAQIITESVKRLLEMAERFYTSGAKRLCKPALAGSHVDCYRSESVPSNRRSTS